MGLTHSWRRPTELSAEAFRAAVADIRKVLKASNVPLAGFHGVGESVMRDDAVVFNGVGRAAVEPFEIHCVEFDRLGRPAKFSFCKTAGLPYDLAVRATLIVLKHHLGDQISVTSDADDASWAPACQLVQNALSFGADFKLDSKA
jgi:hypothetical protein